MRVRVLTVVMALTAIGVHAAAPVVTPHDAIVDAVARKLGVPASIVVSQLRTSVASEAALEAYPAPDARLAEPTRFVLTARGVRRGIASAIVTVVARHPRAARAIERNQAIDRGAVNFIEGEMAGVPLRGLLAESDIVGLTARRDIAAGEVLTAAIVRVPPLVKSGDEVSVTVRIGAVEVARTGIASGSGQMGDTIRVLQPHSTRTLKGRIVGRGAVEVVQ